MIELVIEERRRSIGPFEVGRVLPFAKRRMVGPFIFLDHMGPMELPKGVSRDTDVRPHPHIGLSTVTYLFAGEITHRDSTGIEQAIRPGEMNWMIAGRGITQSARLERARRESVLMLVGGAQVGEPYIEWSFVSSSTVRLAQAKADWQAGRMKLPDADNEEYTPLPPDPAAPPPAMS